MKVLGHIILLNIPILSFFYALIEIDNIKKYKEYIFYLTYFVFVLSYSYSAPYDANTDLVRYYDWAKEASNLEGETIFTYWGDGLYIYNIMLYIAGTINMIHLLPAVTTSIVYGITLYISVKFACSIDKQEYIPLVLIIQLLMMPYLEIVNNIRNIFSFSLFFLGLYIDLIKKRKIGYLFYIIPVFIHATGFLYLIIRLIMFVIKNNIKLFTIVSMIIPMIFINFINQINLANMVDVFDIKIYNLLLKFQRYSNRVDFEQSGHLLLYQSISAVLIILIVLFLSYRLYNNNSLYMYKKILAYIIILCLMSILVMVVSPTQLIYWRFYTPVFMCSGIVILLMMANEKNSGTIQFTTYMLSFLAFFNFVFEIMLARTWVDIDESALFFTNNIFTISYEALTKIF